MAKGKKSKKAEPDYGVNLGNPAPGMLARAERVLDELDREEVAPDERGPKLFVSNSELVSFAECPLQWHLKIVDRAVPPRGWDDEGQDRLSRGTAWHTIMEIRARGLETGKTADEIDAKVRQWLREDLSVQWWNVQAEEFDLLAWMWEGYVERWGMDEEWEMISHEEHFEIDMPVPGALDLKYTGRIDNMRRHRETGEIYIVDYKSKGGKNLANDAIINEMLLEDQFIMYQAAKQRLGVHTDQVLRDVARTDRLKRPMTLEERFARIPFRYPQAVLDQVWDEKIAVATRLVRAWNGEEQVHSVPDTMRCSWKCDFYKPHLESRYSGKSVLDVALGYGFIQKNTNALPPELEEQEDLSW